MSDNDTNDAEPTPEAMNLLASVSGTDRLAVTEAVLETVVSAPRDAVHDIQGHTNGNVEVWLNVSLTGPELATIQDAYDVVEIGVYGDPMLAGTPEGSETDGKFHAVLDPKTDE